MKWLKTTKGAVVGAAALLIALGVIGNKLDVWGFPLPASKARVELLTLDVADNREVIWTRAQRADRRDLWELEQRCKQNDGCSADQAEQKRRLMEDIREAEGQLKRLKRGRQ